ncbi:Runt-Related Transcription Factor 1 [Manis pentadactyla]|nr:Runt-Related Transcription Factor 1 [Manis pentadactyla]
MTKATTDSSLATRDTASERCFQHLKNFCVPSPSLGGLFTISPASGTTGSGIQAEARGKCTSKHLDINTSVSLRLGGSHI